MARRPSSTDPYRISPGAYRVRDVPPRQRPREEMERLGAQHVSDAVLLAVILRSGVRGMNVIEIAAHLIRRYGSLTALTRLSVEELAAVRGMGRVKAQVLKAALELARRLSEEQTPARCRIRSPLDVAALMRERIRPLEEEVFWVLLLDARNQLKGRPLELTRGLLDANLIHPREAFREAVRSACAALVLVHNHPSGDPAPSAEDIRITRQLVQAGTIVDIKVLDHIIFGKPAAGRESEFVSLRESGTVKFPD
ncbi:MAG: DNA repair protein RadC [Kiritimatiellae bacterium]|nr:DNA repair protein RadC [Kiritimatiellia bacterium]